MPPSLFTLSSWLSSITHFTRLESKTQAPKVTPNRGNIFYEAMLNVKILVSAPSFPLTLVCLLPSRYLPLLEGRQVGLLLDLKSNRWRKINLSASIVVSVVTLIMAVCFMCMDGEPEWKMKGPEGRPIVRWGARGNLEGRLTPFEQHPPMKSK